MLSQKLSTKKFPRHPNRQCRIQNMEQKYVPFKNLVYYVSDTDNSSHKAKWLTYCCDRARYEKDIVLSHREIEMTDNDDEGHSTACIPTRFMQTLDTLLRTTHFNTDNANNDDEWTIMRTACFWFVNLLDLWLQQTSTCTHDFYHLGLSQCC